METISEIDSYLKYETAKLLKEKVGNFISEVWYCNYTSSFFPDKKFQTIQFDDDNRFDSQYEFLCYAPTHGQVMKWFRKNKNFLIVIKPVRIEYSAKIEFYYEIYGLDRPLNIVCDLNNDNEHWEKYEDAEDAAIRYILNNLL